MIVHSYRCPSCKVVRLTNEEEHAAMQEKLSMAKQLGAPMPTCHLMFEDVFSRMECTGAPEHFAQWAAEAGGG